MGRRQGCSQAEQKRTAQPHAGPESWSRIQFICAPHLTHTVLRQVRLENKHTQNLAQNRPAQLSKQCLWWFQFKEVSRNNKPRETLLGNRPELTSKATSSPYNAKRKRKGGKKKKRRPLSKNRPKLQNSDVRVTPFTCRKVQPLCYGSGYSSSVVKLTSPLSLCFSTNKTIVKTSNYKGNNRRKRAPTEPRTFASYNRLKVKRIQARVDGWKLKSQSSEAVTAL